jgi:hypothetical protein
VGVPRDGTDNDCNATDRADEMERKEKEEEHRTIARRRSRQLIFPSTVL